MDLNPAKFPNATAYIDALPAGLDSYPDCAVKADVHEDLAVEFPDLKNLDLPEIMKQYVNDQYPSVWLPETVGNGLLMVVRDAFFPSNDAFLDWATERTIRLFNKPVYKLMMHVFSTSLIIMGAAKRWAKFHQGSSLNAKPVKKIEGRFKTAGSLTYPPHLFSGLIVPQLASVYLAALKTNNAEDPEVVHREKSDTEAAFFVSWKA
jgi:hypothetical protein